MSVYCKLGATDIPPIGCREFDPNWCRLDMKCPFLEEDTEETCEPRTESEEEREYSKWMIKVFKR